MSLRETRHDLPGALVFLSYAHPTNETKEPIRESAQAGFSHPFCCSVRQGRRQRQCLERVIHAAVRSSGRPHWSWCHVPLSDLLEVVLRLRQRDRREDQLSVDRL